MPYLVLNNMTAPVAFGDGSREDDTQGTTGRTITGGMHTEIRARRSQYQLTASLLTIAELLAWEGVFKGLGHTWNFDASLYSSKSLLFSLSPNATLVSAHPKFGAQNLNIALTTLGYYNFDTPQGWTVAVWFYDGGSTTWVHRMETSDGVQWEDGVQGAYGWSLAPSGGVFSLTVGEWDDLVLLTYPLTSAMGDQYPQADPYSLLPTLNLTGDICYNIPVSVRGMFESIGVSWEQASVNGVWQSVGTLGALLREE